MLGGGQEVAIVGIDILETMLNRAGQMQGVGGTEKDLTTGFPVKLLQSMRQGIRKRNPVEQAVLRVVHKLPQSGLVAVLLESPLPKGTMQGRDDFRLRVPRTGQGNAGTSQSTHLLKPPIPEVKPNQIRGVEVKWISRHRGPQKSNR